MTDQTSSIKPEEAFTVVLDNFTQTVSADRFAARSVTAVLKGLIEGLNPAEVDDRPEELLKIIAKTPSSHVELDGWRKSLWLQRLASIFTEANGWNAYGELTGAIKSIDSNEYVPSLSEGESIFYYSVERNEALALVLTPFDLDVRIYSSLSVSERVQRFEDLVELPDPFEGKIVKMTSDDVEILGLTAAGLQDYSEDAEAAVKWMGSIADPLVRERLQNAGLEPRAGLLLEGPPGSGKTTLARREAVRHAGDATVIYPSPEVRVEEIFDFAAKYEVVLIVLEDVESFFGERGGSSFSEFLNALDGAAEETGLMILATTNDSSGFDEAIRRPGRLERRAVISSVHEGFLHALLADRLSHFPDKDLEGLAETIGWKASDTNARVTPALADSFARAVIMGDMNPSEARRFLAHEWEPTYRGESYVS